MLLVGNTIVKHVSSHLERQILEGHRSENRVAPSESNTNYSYEAPEVYFSDIAAYILCSN